MTGVGLFTLKNHTIGGNMEFYKNALNGVVEPIMLNGSPHLVLARPQHSIDNVESLLFFLRDKKRNDLIKIVKNKILKVLDHKAIIWRDLRWVNDPLSYSIREVFFASFVDIDFLLPRVKSKDRKSARIAYRTIKRLTERRINRFGSYIAQSNNLSEIDSVKINKLMKRLTPLGREYVQTDEELIKYITLKREKERKLEALKLSYGTISKMVNLPNAGNMFVSDRGIKNLVDGSKERIIVYNQYRNAYANRFATKANVLAQELQDASYLGVLDYNIKIFESIFRNIGLIE
jgi:hypothetical protein